jgi:hypothetical protein
MNSVCRRIKKYWTGVKLHYAMGHIVRDATHLITHMMFELVN